MPLRCPTAWLLRFPFMSGWRSACLSTFVVLIIGGTTAADETLFCIGVPDGYAAEFGLARDGAGYEQFSRQFNQPVRYVVGESRAADWPYIHPAPRDTWAGGTSHSFEIEFHSPRIENRPLYLTLGLAGAHPAETSRVVIHVSDHRLPAQTAPSGRCIDRRDF